jgi:hypothetical protein
MISDTGKDVPKICFGIKAVELCRFDQRPDRPFCGIVIDLDAAVIEETAK